MKTAVEWLEEFMENGKQKSEGIVSLAFAKAKAMEKGQLSDAWYAGDEDGPIHDFEQYYNETFKSE